MALISLILFIACLIGLFLPGWTHEIVAVVLLLALILHNRLNLVFYSKLSRLQYGGSRKRDVLLIVALGAAMTLVYLSGAALFMNYLIGIAFLPAFPWMPLHLGSAVATGVLLVLHMMHEWG